MSYSQLPDFVKDSSYVDKKLSHLKKKQLSSWRVLKNINGILKELQKNNSKEAFNQRVMLVSSVICPRYGVPEIDETRNVIEAAKKLNRSFLTGDQSTLTVEQPKRKEVYPKEVQEIATECWMNDATIPEPNKHQRPQCAPVDLGGETIPQRLQVMTNDDAYQQFKEKYSHKVEAAMKRKCESLRAKHLAKTSYNTAVNARIDKMEGLFPSKGWFITKKPPETKVNNDHTTGLCKDCYSAQENFNTLQKYAKSNCHCKTTLCPNWNCFCGEEGDCQCDPVCSCDDCASCQVCKVLFNKTNQAK